MLTKLCKDCDNKECSRRTPAGECYEMTLEETQKLLLSEADWDTFRREAAKGILCAVLAGGIANGAKGFDAQKEELVNASIDMADELIKQLRP